MSLRIAPSTIVAAIVEGHVTISQLASRLGADSADVEHLRERIAAMLDVGFLVSDDGRTLALSDPDGYETAVTTGQDPLPALDAVPHSTTGGHGSPTSAIANGAAGQTPTAVAERPTATAGDPFTDPAAEAIAALHGLRERILKGENVAGSYSEARRAIAKIDTSVDLRRVAAEFGIVTGRQAGLFQFLPGRIAEKVIAPPTVADDTAGVTPQSTPEPTPIWPADADIAADSEYGGVSYTTGDGTVYHGEIVLHLDYDTVRVVWLDAPLALELPTEVSLDDNAAQWTGRAGEPPDMDDLIGVSYRGDDQIWHGSVTSIDDTVVHVAWHGANLPTTIAADDPRARWMDRQQYHAVMGRGRSGYTDDELENDDEPEYDDPVMPDPEEIYRHAPFGDAGAVLMTDEGLATLAVNTPDGPVVLSNLLNYEDTDQIAEDIRDVLETLDGGAETAHGRVWEPGEYDPGYEPVQVHGRRAEDGTPVVEFSRPGRDISATVTGDDARKAAKAFGEINHQQGDHDPNDPTNSAELPEGETLRPKGRTRIDHGDYNDFGVVGAIVDTPTGPRARLAMVGYGDHHKYSGGRSNAAVELDVATIDAIETALAEFEQAGRAHKAEFDRRAAIEQTFWDEYAELDGRHRRWIRGGDESAKLTAAELARWEELAARSDQLWDGFEPDDVLTEAQLTTPWGTLIMRAEGRDDGDGGWDVELGVRPQNAGDEWEWGETNEAGWTMPRAAVGDSAGIKNLRRWLRKARTALAEAA